MRIPGLILVVALLTVGCSSGSQVAPVSGKITLDEKALPNARISFQPSGDATNPGIGSYGKTNARGEYTLNLTDDSGPGAMVGMHRVVVVAYDGDPEAAEKDDRIKLKHILPRKYNMDTVLTFEVKPGPNTANFDLKSR